MNDEAIIVIIKGQKKKRQHSDREKVDELDKFKRRMIRATARLLVQEKKPEEQLWDDLKKETGCDCKLIWTRMRALTLKKLDRLLLAGDCTAAIPNAAKMTLTDWLLFDLVLVHQDIDLLGKNLNSKRFKENPVALSNVFELVKRFNIEGLRGEELAEAWSAATSYYYNQGHQCSPMLLQRRWHQLKEVTRTQFYDYWYAYRGTHKRLSMAEPHAPTPLQTAVAKWYKLLILTPFMEWEELIKQRLVALPEEFENINMERMGHRRPVRNPLSNDAPDLVMIEPNVETIDLGCESDDSIEDKLEENSLTPLMTIKQEPQDMDIGETEVEAPKKSIYDVVLESMDKDNEIIDRIDLEALSGSDMDTAVREIEDITDDATDCILRGDKEPIMPQITNIFGNVSDTSILANLDEYSVRQIDEDTERPKDTDTSITVTLTDTKENDTPEVFGVTNDHSGLCKVFDPSKNNSSSDTDGVKDNNAAVDVDAGESDTGLSDNSNTICIIEDITARIRDDIDDELLNDGDNFSVPSADSKFDYGDDKETVALSLDFSAINDNDNATDNVISTVKDTTKLEDNKTVVDAEIDEPKLIDKEKDADDVEILDTTPQVVEISDSDDNDGIDEVPKNIGDRSSPVPADDKLAIDLLPEPVELTEPEVDEVAITSEVVEKQPITDVKSEIANFTLSQLSHEFNFADEGIEFADDGIVYYEEDNDVIPMKTENNVDEEENDVDEEENDVDEEENDVDEEENDVDEEENDVDEEENDVDEEENEDTPQIDPKLLLYPIVITTRLDDMKLFSTQTFDHVSDASLLNKIALKSKPIKKTPVSINKQTPATDSCKFVDNTPIKIEPNPGQVIDESSDDDSENDNIIIESQKIKPTNYLLQKPRSRTYNPIQLCKNPDFNTKLKRLTVSFFRSPRNCIQFKTLKPLTIDLSKGFESKLINGRLYLKPPDNNAVTNVINDTENRQSTSILPSAMPAQSLIDNSKVIDVLPIIRNQMPIAQLPDVQNSASERNKVINLPDISEIRRINQQLLTAEVTPIQVQNHQPQVPVTIVATTNTRPAPTINSRTITATEKDLLPAATDARGPPKIVDITGDLPSRTSNSAVDKNATSTARADKPITIPVDRTPKTVAVGNKKNWPKTTSSGWKLRQVRPLIPWFIKHSGTVINNRKIEESLLTLDSLNKMLRVLDPDELEDDVPKVQKKRGRNKAKRIEQTKPDNEYNENDDIDLSFLYKNTEDKSIQVNTTISEGEQTSKDNTSTDSTAPLQKCNTSTQGNPPQKNSTSRQCRLPQKDNTSMKCNPPPKHSTGSQCNLLQNDNTSMQGKPPQKDNTSTQGKPPQIDNTSTQGKPPQKDNTSTQGEPPQKDNTSTQGEPPQKDNIKYCKTKINYAPAKNDLRVPTELITYIDDEDKSKTNKPETGTNMEINDTEQVKKKIQYCCWARQRMLQLLFCRKVKPRHDCEPQPCTCCCKTLLQNYLLYDRKVNNVGRAGMAKNLRLLQANQETDSSKNIQSDVENSVGTPGHVSKDISGDIIIDVEASNTNPTTKNTENELIDVDAMDTHDGASPMCERSVTSQGISPVVTGAMGTPGNVSSTADVSINIIPTVTPEVGSQTPQLTHCITADRLSGGTLINVQNLNKPKIDDPPTVKRVLNFKKRNPPYSAKANLPSRFSKSRLVGPKVYKEKMIYLNSKHIAEKPSDNPIFLGKNKILLTTIKFPPNLKLFEEAKKSISTSLSIPQGVRLICLPNGTISFNIDPNIKVNTTDLERMPAIIAKIQAHMKSKAEEKEATNKQTDALSFEKNENEVVDLVNDDHESTSYAKQNKNNETTTVPVQLTGDNAVVNNTSNSQSETSNKPADENETQTGNNPNENTDQSRKSDIQEYVKNSCSNEISLVSMEQIQDRPVSLSQNVTTKNSEVPQVEAMPQQPEQLADVITIDRHPDSATNILSTETPKKSVPRTKNILSDLMEMSGIFEEDMIPAPEETVPMQVPADTVIPPGLEVAPFAPKELVITPVVPNEVVVTSLEPNEMVVRPLVSRELVITPLPPKELVVKPPAPVPVSAGIISPQCMIQPIPMSTALMTANKVPTIIKSPIGELSPITSLCELKYACFNKGIFFKLDFDTGFLVPINVCMKQQNKMKSPCIAPKSVIDLTDDDDSVVVQQVPATPPAQPTSLALLMPVAPLPQPVSSAPSPPPVVQSNTQANISPTKRSLLIVNNLSEPTAAADATTSTSLVKPVKLFKSLKPNILHQLNADKMVVGHKYIISYKNAIKHKIKRKQFLGKINMNFDSTQQRVATGVPVRQYVKRPKRNDDQVSEQQTGDSTTVSDDSILQNKMATDVSDDSSDDEPLAKKAKRKKDNNLLVVKQTAETESAAVVEDDYISDYENEIIESISPFEMDQDQSNDEEESCILGV